MAATMRGAGSPIFILGEDARRTSGRDAQTWNEFGRAGVLVDGETVDVADPVDAGVFDPAAVKREAIAAATEAATMIVRIDDVIAAE